MEVVMGSEAKVTLSEDCMIKTQFVAILLTLALSSTANAATSLSYVCKSKEVAEHTLKVDQDHLELRPTNKREDGYSIRAKFDSSYRSNSSKLRYMGTLDSNTANVVMSAELLSGGFILRDGSRGGFIQIQQVDDGFWTLNMVCFAR
jgi:hypothetical protein